MTEFVYSSPFKEYIQGMILQKRSLGYKYDGSPRVLYQFDQFCLAHGCTEPVLSKELVQIWTQKHPNEALATLHHRVGIIRQLALYMNQIGVHAYVLPKNIIPKGPAYIPYIFSNHELAAFFKQVDSCHYCAEVPYRHWIMPLLFRILYGCGLRVSEALHLKVRDVNLLSGVLTIWDGKFNKDRLVPLSTELLDRCHAYVKQIHMFSEPDDYFFPSPNKQPITIGNIYKNFRKFLWKARISHGGWGKGPRVHDFRHTFCVHCLKRWVLEGKDLTAYLPVLKTYLGHHSFCDTSQYLRLTAELYPDITAKVEHAFGHVIPALGGDCKEGCGLAIEHLCLHRIDEPLIVGFLAWLEQDRNNSIATRNQRLACIHGFFRYMQIEDPVGLLSHQKILTIPMKKALKPTIAHLTPDALKLILAQPDLSKACGRRDLTMLSVLYDTGARVQELADLIVRNVRLDPPPILALAGKGSKIRQVPLMSNTESLLRQYMMENHLLQNGMHDRPLFSNRQLRKLTPAGITFILNKYTACARAVSSIVPDKVTPHVFRHTKAMHLLHAGVNLIYIRDLLGHVDISTTEIYARIDTELKRKALEKAYPEIVSPALPPWSQDEDLLTWLTNL